MRNRNLIGTKEAFTHKATALANKKYNDADSNFLRVTGTIPSTTSSFTNGVDFAITSSGSSTLSQCAALRTDLFAGHTGNSFTLAILATNFAAGTGNSLSSGKFNGAISGVASGTTTGLNIGGAFEAKNGDTCYGTSSAAVTTKNSGINIGGLFLAQNTGTSPTVTGIHVKLGSGSSLSHSSAVALLDNGTTTYPILLCRDGGTVVFTIDDGGNYKYDRTITTAGTTGAQTINKAVGTVNFAAAATSLVVTNSLVTTSSIIFCTIRTNDATMTSVQCVAGSGSFTIYPNAAPTGETSVGFLVTN